ncbi:alpha/beta hydrolase [Sinosporangium siamense]|uniref:Peptidase n=1 Tax=Sinosporangium siamense TaxID=1367973 RepID=A0A919RNI4_9ACTN|nr:alpha/beta hydrolase [Sinosporangium siamense]GII97045.1 peptidase [Sinosporangium siamense]
MPIDWSEPEESGTVEIAVARRKATDPAARIGSLVLHPGGPGGSGVGMVFDSSLYASPELARRFDLVGFDARGGGRSHPIICSNDALAGRPGELIQSQAEFDALVAYNARLRADCRVHTGPLFDHVDMLSVVRDLDLLRAALGDEQLTFYGMSYGSLLGQLYAETFPHRVRALALDGVYDHSLGTRAMFDSQARAAEDGFNEFADWCERETACVLHGRDIRQFWANLKVRADRGELNLPGYPLIKLTRWHLISSTLGSLHIPVWRFLARMLKAIDEGVMTSAAQAQLPVQTWPQPVQAFCQDYYLPVRDYREYARHLRRAARIAPNMEFSAYTLYAIATCLGHPDSIPNPQRRLRVRGSAPLLLVNARHDVETGTEWPANVAAQLGRQGVLLTYDGWGYQSYRKSPCVAEAVDRYLVSLTLPARGTHCPAVPVPTAAGESGPPASVPLPGPPGWGF